jgi:phosphoglucomutase
MFKHEEGAWVCLRPSGTEPNVNFGVTSNPLKESKQKLQLLKRDFMAVVQERIVLFSKVDIFH